MGKSLVRTRARMEEAERVALAPFAQFSGDSLGRVHGERPHPHRTEYQRDRSRIIHSRAFRRLEYKTQVFLNGSGDHYRTRLTHTMEVASVSRTIARSLGLNEDLAEAIALAHDLGHAPFGHSGEEMLDALMREDGGFDHNGQSLRVVELLERQYPRFDGLNLTFEVREGLRKHAAGFRWPEEKGGGAYRSPSLEAQVADLADELTYYSHDLDDGLDAGLLSVKALGKLEAWGMAQEAAEKAFPRLRAEIAPRFIVRTMIDLQVQDVIEASAAAIGAAGVKGADDVRRHRGRLIVTSKRLGKANRALRKFLYEKLYYHPVVAGANQRACRLLKGVFEAYLRRPEALTATARARVRADGIRRAVCDYIAGMTDRFLVDEYNRLCASAEGRYGRSARGARRVHE